jgi:activator of HSP90 ATPase
MRQIDPVRMAVALGAMLVLLSTCGISAASSVNKLLDARDAAISQRDITAYATLIADDYHGNRQSKSDMIKQMRQLFAQFSQLQMKSFDRDISIIDSNHAEATQSYRLKVMMDGKWREMLQREELSLTRGASGWQISSGL